MIWFQFYVDTMKLNRYISPMVKHKLNLLHRSPVKPPVDSLVLVSTSDDRKTEFLVLSHRNTVAFSHWGQDEEPKGTNSTTVLANLCLRKCTIKAYHNIYSVSNEHKDAVDNLALVLNIFSPQENEGREEILTEMFSDYILMTKSIHRWATSRVELGWSHCEGQAVSPLKR